ncbi:uncharacterized protein LOC143293653 [Babylonia areolata]|uniref:uncharacterized protein LOC143293653 n=1 Tax=Babylonia areolata TaxID=304850 RepID=UPI003FD2AD22
MMGSLLCYLLVFFALLLVWASGDGVVPLPNFQELARAYPGYAHHGGRYHNHHLLRRIGLSAQDSRLLLHDTSALRLSYALNRVGGRHSLGRQLIRLSKFGHDSVSGKDGLEYIFHPIAYGPYMADKYGYPSVSKLHAQDPVSTKKNFWGRQGILRVITYTRRRNMPKGHVALWDCNHFHQSQDWVAGHSLLTVEFWESPDSNCSLMDSDPRYLSHSADLSGGTSLRQGGHSSSRGQPQQRQGHQVPLEVEASRPHPKLRHKHWERRFISRHHLAPEQPTAGRALSKRSLGQHVRL